MSEKIFSNAMNDLGSAHVQISYVGEQTKPVLPVAFTTDWPGTARPAAAAQATTLMPPYTHLCTKDEMKALLGALYGFAKAARSTVTAAITEREPQPFLVVTVARRLATNEAMEHAQSIDRTQAPKLLDSVRDALHELDRPAREAVERLRLQIL